MNKNKQNILDKKTKNNNLLSFKELFCENHYFRIPDYQRGYAWNPDKELSDLWKDILRLFKTTKDANEESNKEKYHYMGMLSLQQIENEDLKKENLLETNSFYIVDGQQRITSLVIIIQTIIRYLNEEDIETVEYKELIKGDDGYKFGYSEYRNSEEKDYFNETIYNNKDDDIGKNLYLQNICTAKKYIEKQLNYLDDDKIVGLLELILNNLKFNIYFITKEFDVRVTFETMNNRGKPLTNLELLKNRLMYLSSLFNRYNDRERLKGIIEKKWKKIYDNLSFEDSNISDDEYLKAHWIVYKKLDKAKGDSYIKNILEDEFAIDGGEFLKRKTADEKDASAYLENYINSLSDYSEYWAKISNPEAFTNNLKSEAWIKRLSRLPNIFYAKVTVMVVYANRELKDNEKEEFYYLLEQFIFVNKLLGQSRNDMSFLVTEAKNLFNKNEDTNENALTYLRDLECSITKHELGVNKERIEKAISSFTEYIDGKNNGYYDWNGLRYFLYEYNNSLESDIKENNLNEWCKLSNSSIEHILPQSPTSEYWKVAFRDYINNPDKLNKITNTLGNLLLLSNRNENSSLQNYSFPVKKNLDKNNARFSYADGSRCARLIATNECWTPKEIYENSIRMLEFMRVNWFNKILNKTEWDKLVEDKGLLKFEYNKELFLQKYDDLKNELNTIDISKERNEIVEILSKKQNNEEYEEKNIMKYFDESDYEVYFRKKPSYIENKFACKLSMNGDTLDVFECKVKINNENYYICYHYIDNNIEITKNSFHYKALADLPKQIISFTKMFYKYLKRELKKSNPNLI